ncbi:MAG TPA: ABC transporter permease [Candidatus Solibacter sp.]|nr:ABC transporter permease [Candidatus Solibacter sp.]
MDALIQDLRYAVRQIGRAPGFASVAVLTLAIGIGANTAVFSVINSVLLKPLRYPEPDELVAVWHKAPGAPGLTDVSGDLRLSPSMYFTYAERNRTFQSIGVWITRSATVTGRADPEQVRVLGVSDGALQALAVRPALGRWLTNADQTPGGAEVVMLSHGYWRRRFGGDQSAIGRSIVIDSQPREVVGVMPEGFRFVNADFDVILPMRFDRSRVILPGFGFQAVARLKAGVTIPEASADVARMVPIWMTSWPAAPTVNPRIYESWRIAPALRPLKQDVIQNVGSVLWVVMGTVGIVMLIACANAANLLLVRAEGRQHELAIRAALGAGRTRIIGGLLIESVLLGVAGGVLGLALAYASLRFLLAAEPANLPRLTEISVDGRTLSFIVAVSLLSGISFGLIPALKQAGSHAGLALRSAGRTSSQSRERHRTRNLLVVTQVALAVVLLVSSALMIRTFQALRRVEPGFTNPPQLQTMRISIPASLVAEPERVARLQNELVEKFAAIPGVTSAGFGSAMPMEGFPPFNWDAIRVEGREGLATETPPLRLFKNVSPGFFQTAGMRLIAGRDYTWTDLYDLRRVVMVSENLARELWGKPSDAVGKRIRTIPGAPLHEIIAVVEDVRENGLHESAPTIVYWPAYGPTPYLTGQNVTRTATFVVRSERAGTEAFLNQVRQAVLSVNAGLAIASVRTMQEVYDLSMARTSFTLVMLAIAGFMALLLGVIGIYGIISYAVSQRTREMGIRLALGAQQRSLKRMFVRYGLVLAGIGVAIGLSAAIGLTRLMRSLLFEISPLDPLAFAAAPILLVAAALLASYLPARRAAAVDPVEALRME